MDLRYAFRTLASTPGFTALAVATLALCIGINTVVFTIYGSVVFRRLSVPAPEDIVRLQWHSGDRSSDQFSWSEYNRLAASTRAFASVLATSTPQIVVCQFSDAMSVHTDVIRVRLVSGNYFDTLGIKAEIGKSFGRNDHHLAVVSHSFWTSKLHADTKVLEKTLSIQGVTFSIVGVMPPQFTGTGMPPQAPDLWLSASAQTSIMPDVDWMRDVRSREWQLLARRRRAVTAGQYSAELAVLSQGWPPEAERPVQLSAKTATFFQTDGGAFDSFVAVCMVLMIAVGLVLLIGCVNLTNLIGARNSGRAQELAVRLALGAGRWRLMKQLCVESLCLGVLGGVVGLFLSIWTCDWLEAKASQVIQEVSNGAIGLSLDFSPSWRILFGTAVLSVMVGIALGIMPAVRASGKNVNSILKQGLPLGFGGLGIRSHRNFLLASQVASCLVLLVAAGLLFRGAARSSDIDAGFDVKHLAVVAVDARTVAGSAQARHDLQREVLIQLQAVPTVESVAWADRAPFLGTGSGPFQNDRGATLGCIFNGVSLEYFGTLGIQLRSGRTFSKLEVEQQLPVALISESTARRLWPGQSPLGRRISPATSWLKDVAGQGSFTVVGVVKSIRSTYLSKEDNGYVYMPRRLPDSNVLFLVRTRNVPESSFDRLTAALAKVNTNLPARTYIFSLERGPVQMQELMARAPAMAASVLGGLALILACLGIYGVVSHLVSQRTREIGIRMALGATHWDVIGAIARQTLWPVAWGAAVGLLGAFAVSGLLRTIIVMPDLPDLTYGAGAFDATTFISVLSILGAVVLAATFIPMRRAMLVEPTVALRNE